MGLMIEGDEHVSLCRSIYAFVIHSGESGYTSLSDISIFSLYPLCSTVIPTVDCATVGMDNVMCWPSLDDPLLFQPV